VPGALFQGETTKGKAMHPLLIELIDLLNEIRKANERRARDSFGQDVREMRVDYIGAAFYCNRKRIGSLGCIEALDALANGVHRFEDFDIADATRVKLEQL